MAIPKYYETYRPFLECLKDGQQHAYKNIKDYIASAMSISEEERKIMLPSGKQAIFDNRIGWARTYLKKAELIDCPSRAVFVITPEGERALKEAPVELNDDYLSRYPSFRIFKNPNAVIDDVVVITQPAGTPQDVLDQAFAEMNASLADELLAEIMKQSPSFFENLVVELLTKMGYGGSLSNSGIVTGQSGDEGIDGIIREDKLGFSHIYIQAKRWEPKRTAGRPEIQKFVGALAGQGATKGLFITTAKFTKEAIAYAEKQHTTKVVLVDGDLLTKLMIDHNLGVSPYTAYEIKKLDTDFFTDEDRD